MAHIWSLADSGEWLAWILEAQSVRLSAVAPRVQAAAPVSSGVDSAAVLLHRSSTPSGAAWVLLAGAEAGIRVNGVAAGHGIVQLRDRDEIRWPSSSPVFFSTEQLAVVVPVPDDGARGFCPRCKQAIAAGEPAVRCPACAVWHHATEALPCWTYAERCAACPQPTAADTGFAWTPEAL
jgi:hypothetical protein